MRWPWCRRRQESAALERAKAVEAEVDRRLELSRRQRPKHEAQAERVAYQLRTNHFGELMRASWEGR